MTHAEPHAHPHAPHAGHGPAHTAGRVLHSALGYDVLAWLFLGGRERAFRQRIVDLAGVRPGDAVLDVGCGTGTLALLAKEHAGPAGSVHGIDASAEMVARAQKKARRARLDVTFTRAVAQSLPFPDARFDVVLGTMMLHHLPASAREACAREVRRVARPGARIVFVDFGGPPRQASFLDHFHRHGGIELAEIVRLTTDAGLKVVETGAVGTQGLPFVRAEAS